MLLFAILTCICSRIQAADMTVAPSDTAKPEITNCPDTIDANHCNIAQYQFEADPGSYPGAMITGWSVIAGQWSIGANGFFQTSELPCDTYYVKTEVTNNRSFKDTCEFYVVAETEHSVLPKEEVFFDPDRDYLFGPEGAESLTVIIVTNGTTHDLDALGVTYRQVLRSIRGNYYLAQVSVHQYLELRKAKSVIRVTAKQRGQDSKPNTITAPLIDTSKSTISDADTLMPHITNCPDTIDANHCNVAQYQFEADPGSYPGAGVSSWTVLSGSGSIGQSGFYSSGDLSLGTYAVTAEVTNNHVPAYKDTCEFYVVAETEHYTESKGRFRVPYQPFRYGPPEAESLTVEIITDGSDAGLEAKGIKLDPIKVEPGYGCFSARVSVEQFEELKKLRDQGGALKYVIPSGRQKLKLWEINSIESPSLDTSTAPPSTPDN
jgi:hypothetical protein